jgi:hypothetical protein
MKTLWVFFAVCIVQLAAAQQPTDALKGNAQNRTRTRQVVSPHPAKLLSELEGINQAWVKDLQQRTREYWLKRKNASRRKDSVAVQQTSRPKHEVLSKVAAPTPTASVVWEIPFASKNNTIELSIQNTTGINASIIDVEVTKAPSWLTFSPKTFHIGEMAGKEEKIATLTFSVDKFAPIGSEQSVTVAVTSSTGQTWSKEITLKVSPPDKFELYQNYPNPFNPTTTVSYQLSADSKVSLKIYDILGREVLTLADGEQQVGYHQEKFDANRLASGVYVYRIVYTDQSGSQASANKRMLLIK